MWASAAACMRNYLLFRSGPRRSGPTRRWPRRWPTSRVPELSRSTLDAGEGWEALLSAGSDFDPEAAAARGMHYERLDQLALEHLLGAR